MNSWPITVGWVPPRGQTNIAGSSLGEVVEQGLDSLDIAEQVFYNKSPRKRLLWNRTKQRHTKCIKKQCAFVKTTKFYGRRRLPIITMVQCSASIGNLELAAQILQNGSRIAEANQFIWITASILSNLAVLAYFQQDYQPAIDLFLLSNEKSAQYGDLHRSPSVNHNNLAECYAMLGQLDKASEHLEAALHHFNECGNVVFLPYVYNTLAVIHLQAKKHPEARKALNDGIKSAVENQMYTVLNNLLIDYAKYFLLTTKSNRQPRSFITLPNLRIPSKKDKIKLTSYLKQLGEDLHKKVCIACRASPHTTRDIGYYQAVSNITLSP